MNSEENVSLKIYNTFTNNNENVEVEIDKIKYEKQNNKNNIYLQQKSLPKQQEQQQFFNENKHERKFFKNQSSNNIFDSGTKNSQNNYNSVNKQQTVSPSLSSTNPRSFITEMGILQDKKKWFIGLAFLIVLALAITFLVLFLTKKGNDTQNDIRLNKNILPSNYNLEITPDFDKNKFNGTVVIDIEILKYVPDIRVHSQNLNILDYSMVTVDGSKRSSVSIKMNENKNYQYLIFKKQKDDFYSGNYSLTINFDANFKLGSFTGFYKTSYKTVSGETKELVTTKFEPTYARQAFPCFDETFFKSTFEIKINHPDSMIALSNEGVKSTSPYLPGWKQTEFMKTPKMSTYAVAYVVSDFVYTETKTVRGIPVRVYSRPDQVSKTKYAAEVAANVLDHYEEYTGIPYTLSKLDLIGIPGFISGAMENWGLVTYKENYILYDPSESSFANQRQLAGVISHELAHMWWGNLVTLDWWSELYLNEGYATMIEFKGLNHINSSWSIFDSFPAFEQNGALTTDMLATSRPLYAPNVLTPDQATSVFDAISYNKGASILWMIESYVGKDNFRDAQRRYLSENQYKTTTSEIMLSYFDKFVNESTSGKFEKAYELFKSWINEPSFPILYPKRSPSKDGKTTITIVQKPYLSSSKTVWNVPIKLSTRKGTFTHLLTKDDTQIIIDLKDDEWFKLNTDSDAYYMTSYEDKDWDILISQLHNDFSVFSVRDRSNLLFNAYQLTEVQSPEDKDKQLMTYEKLFKLMEYLKNEEAYQPWSITSAIISGLKSKISSLESLSALQFDVYVYDLVKYIHEKLVDFNVASNPNTYEKTSLFNVLIPLACSAQHEDCLRETDRIFQQYIQTQTPIPPSIRSFVYRYGIQSSNNAKDFEMLWNFYLTELDATEKARLISALASTKNSALLTQLIKYSEDISLVDNENFFSFQQNIASSSLIGRGLIWNYIQNNWLKLVDRFGLNDRRLGNYVRSVCGGFATQTRLKEINDFFKRYPESGAGASARLSAIESVQRNIEWAQKNEALISTELNKKDPTASPWLEWRLNEFVRPSHYDLSLKIDVDNRNFSGKVIIDYKVLVPTNNLILHSRDLNITSSKVVSSSGFVVSNDSAAFIYKENNFFVIPMNDILGIGDYKAEIEYNGKILPDLTGLYLSSYVKPGEKVRTYLATTQFEAGYARKAFPCFDEPSFKAQFTIQITADKKYTSVSNMPIIKTREVDDKWKETSFQRSLTMSTYLVAFIVSDFTAFTSTVNPIFRCLTFNPEINGPRCEYANMAGPTILKAYADYFGNDYQLPKMDQVAVPDFSLGAMENWGLVTYRDVYLLYDPVESPISSKMSVAYIIAHELAHMWFGNQVTIKWWNELWLNEGFAEFMEYKGVEAVHPEWSYSNYFAITELSRVFEVDSSSNSRPILTIIRDENDMQMIFDGVTYAKGASVIRMLEGTIGEDKFKQAIKNYMKKFAYKNTVTTDLWNTFSEVIEEKLDVSEMMNNWISREGFPVVTITDSYDGNIQVTQKRFLKDGKTSDSDTVWFIPLTYKVYSPEMIDLPTIRLNFNRPQNNFTLENYHSNFIYKFNVDQKGVYIVNYPIKTWQRFAEEMNKEDSTLRKQMSVLDRNSLISDAYYLARANMLPYGVAMNISEFLKYETEFVIWQTASDMISYLQEYAAREDGGVAFKKWLYSLVKNRYEALDWQTKPDETDNDKRLRPLIVNLACISDNSHCLDVAKDNLKDFLDNSFIKKRDGYKPDPNTISIALIHGIKTIDDQSEDVQNYEKLLQLYERSTDTAERNRYLRALSSVRNTAKLNELLKRSLNRDFIRKQDFFTFLAFMASNPAALDISWKFYLENYEQFEKDFGLDDPNLGRAVYRFASYFSTEDRKKEVLKLFSDYPIAGAGELYRKQAIELIDANIKWSSQFYSQVSQFVTEKCDLNTCPWKLYRLNPHVIPQKYELLLQVDNDEHWFNGTVKIQIKIEESLSNIVLHADAALKTSNIRVFNDDNFKQNLAKGTQFRYAPFQLLILPLVNQVKGDNFWIQIDFRGDNRDHSMSGLYNGYYTNQAGKLTNLSSTQFQATHAREAFPCFDEPTYKQPIQMTIIHQKKMNTTVTNMPRVSFESIDDNWDKSVFEETNVPLPTYLGAILVSDFVCDTKEAPGIGNTGKPLPIRTCASNANPFKTFQFSLDITPKILESYEKTLNQPYQLPKLDQIGIPQFAAGAMENWGLVKYRENYILWHEDINTAAEQRGVSSVIAHELAHMWFGNSLTCEFWDELWLNEAFASYMEYSSVSDTHPEWVYFDFLMTEDRIGAMTADYVSSSSHPLIRKPIWKPADMSYNVRIIYSKGSTTLHMFNRTLGAANFEKALQFYQEKEINSNVVHQRLYEAFDKFWDYKNYNSTKFFDSWANQAGFPYVNITCEDGKKCQYSQARYSNDINDKTIYSLPYSYYNDQFESSKIEFKDQQNGELSHDKNFIKINPDFQGYFLVNYPKNHWDWLATKMVENENDFVKNLTVNDRAELLYSAYLLTRDGYADPSILMPFFNYLKHEKHFVPFQVYEYIKRTDGYRMEMSKYQESIRAFERRIVDAHYNDELWNLSKKPNPEISYNRYILEMACRSGYQKCIKYVLDKFDDFKNNPNNTAPDLKEIVAYYGMRYSDNSIVSTAILDFDKLFRNSKPNDPWRALYRNSPTMVSNFDIAKEYLKITLDEKVYSKNDYLRILANMVSNSKIRKEIIQWIYENTSFLEKKFSNPQNRELFQVIANTIQEESGKEDLKKALDQMKISSEPFLSIVDENIKWLQKNGQRLGDWYNLNGCGTNDEPKKCPWAELRVDKKAIDPTRYDIKVRVNATSNIFSGSVDITFNTMKELEYLPVQAANQLNVKFESLINKKNSEIIKQISTFRYEPEMYFVLKFPEKLQPSEYILTFTYDSNLLNNGLSGLYRSTYIENNTEIPLASTQMEFYDARKMFPCFDEPAFKSVFGMTIEHETHMVTTLANAPLKETVDIGNGWLRSTYEDTPKMTTYLVAILVSDYVCKENNFNTKVNYIVCAPRIHEHKLVYALQESHMALHKLQELLKIEYPMNKVHLVAIPDFYYGAMENWGLITFRESALLYNADDTTSESKIRISTIIAHEIAHFWFGNLVTCEWWDALFLNEAFATLMQYPSVDFMNGGWSIYEKFLIYDFDRAIAADSVETTHPLFRDITQTKLIDQFDASIIYAKGASVFRMVESMMGSKHFFDALADYMNVRQYQTAQPNDLFSAFDRHYTDPWSGISMTNFIQNWIYKNGFPYLNVTESNGIFKISQKRFLRHETSSSDLETVWNVPISYYANNFNKTEIKIVVMDKADFESILDGIDSNIVPKLNAGHTGFYLVNYSKELWSKFIETLIKKFDTIPVTDRAGLLFDAFTLAAGNKLKYATPLALSKYLKQENDTVPFTLAIRAFDGIRKNVELGSQYGKKFKEFVLEQFEKIYQNLGWEEKFKSQDIEKSLRNKVLDFVCDYEHADCLTEAAKRYNDWKFGAKLSPNILPIALKYGLRADKFGLEWQYVWGLYQNEQSATLRQIYMNGLVGSPNQENIRLLLNSAMKAQGIRGQDSISTMLLVARSYNPIILETVWQFIQKNFDNFFTPESTLKLNDVSRLLTQLSSNYFFTQSRYDELNAFLSTKQALLAPNQYQASLNAIKANIQWLQTRMIEIENFLLCGSESCPFTAFRLPSTVQPSEYDLDISIDLDKEVFSGSVKILVDTTSAKGNKYLHLHADKSLNVESVILKNGLTEIPTKKMFPHDPMQFLVIELENELNVNQLEMNFKFNGKLADDMFGLYKSTYYDPEKKQNVKLASTQFQDIYARRVFPCFDEPAFRAVYKLTIHHSKEYDVHSNMEYLKQNIHDGIRTTVFKPTPKMVSYLLAFVVSDFECGGVAAAPSTTKVSVCATKYEKNSINYGIKITPKIIDSMNKKYDYNYGNHMEKMDLYAIPDFSAGAMENWGLLTFRETRLLWNESFADAANKMAVASVVAHEITHMWFGNLVTCQFWSDLWLNEAFASYMEYFSVHDIEPEWDYWQLFFITDYISGMRSDAASTSHPLIRNVQKPSDIPYISTIIYQKGASILRMFENVFTTEKFFGKLGEYLKENNLTSIPSQVLLNKLASIEGLPAELPVIKFLDNWTKQAGFPYLNVSIKDNVYSVVQKRFLSNGDQDKTSTTWVVPLTYYTDFSGSNKNETIFITKSQEKFQPNINKNLPIKLNINSEGFYIVNYPIEEWKRWIDLLQDESKSKNLYLTSQDMSHLLFDASLLSGAGYLSYEIPLGLTQSLKAHEDFSLWATGSNVLGGLWPYFRSSTSANDVDKLFENAFRKYSQNLVEKIYSKYGIQSPDPGVGDYLQKERLRQTVSSFACLYRLGRCLLEAQVEFSKWRQNSNYILSPNIRATVLRYAIQESKDPKGDWNFMWTVYLAENRVAVKLDYLQALAASQDRSILTNFLHEALNPDKVRRQDYLSTWAYITRTPLGHEVAWQFLKDNIKTIKEKRLTERQIGTVAGYFANYNTKPEQYDELVRFFTQNSVVNIPTVSLENAKQTMVANQNWIKKYKNDVYTWLANKTVNSRSL